MYVRQIILRQRESKQPPVADVIRCAGSRFKTSSRAQIYSKHLILYVLRDRAERERERKTRRAIKILIKESVTDGRLAERYETRRTSPFDSAVRFYICLLRVRRRYYICMAVIIVPYFCISHRNTSVNPVHTLL